MKKLLIILILSLPLMVKSQRIVISDTFTVELCYSDTSCHFDNGSVQSIYNSKCLKFDTVYLVYTLYSVSFVSLDGKLIPRSRNNIWFYKLIPKQDGKRENFYSPADTKFHY